MGDERETQAVETAPLKLKLPAPHPDLLLGKSLEVDLGNLTGYDYQPQDLASFSYQPQSTSCFPCLPFLNHSLVHMKSLIN